MEFTAIFAAAQVLGIVILFTAQAFKLIRPTSPAPCNTRRGSLDHESSILRREAWGNTKERR